MFMIIRRMILAIFTLLSILSQNAAAVPHQHGTDHDQLRSTFKADGLKNDALLTKIFEGDFVNIDLDRTDNRFGILFQQYLEAFAHHCSAALPSNKVQMTRTVCQTEEVSTNIYGAELNRVCVKYKEEPTGLFAKPALYDALKAVDKLRATDVGRELSRAFGDATRPDAISNMVGLFGDAQAIASDMGDLVRMNACKSAGLLRFEENLRLFALNKQPAQVHGEAEDSSPANAQSAKDQDYRKLIEDLILDDTKRWGSLARFVDGSVTVASVEETDKRGRPLRVVAPYQWDGMLGRTTGRASLTFTDGQPECLTYSETPHVCHTPNRRITARYLEGGYSE